ncbi:hypothetical protein BX600DRAFT_513364 [Xylariales sp. PMI_506]|nr:hypothetical protein BX600DRAFT_513364 [Xylariales sp. PMI_506]
MSSNTPKYGQICWLEVPVADAARAGEFYRAVLDWDCKDQALPGPLPAVKQVHFFTKGDLNGAFITVDPDTLARLATDPIKQSVVASYAVQSIEKTLEKVLSSGGKVVVPKTMLGPNMGAFARFEDTEGNVQGVWAKE